MGEVLTYSELRRFPRARVTLPASVSMPLVRGARYDSTVRELGRGGCLLQSEVRFDVGMTLPLRLHLDQEEVWMLGRVLYHRDAGPEGEGHGIEFIDSLSEGELRIEEYVAQRVGAA